MNQLKRMSLWMALGSLIPLAQAQDAIIINGKEVKIGPGQEVVVKDGQVTVTSKSAASQATGAKKDADAVAEAGTITVGGNGLVADEATPWLGVITSPVPPVLQSQLGLAEGTGLVIDYIAPNAPAKDVLKIHDIICKFDDQNIGDSNQFRELVQAKKPGTEVSLLIRRAGKEQTVKVKLALRPQEENQPAGMVQLVPMPRGGTLRLQGFGNVKPMLGTSKSTRTFNASSCIVENDGQNTYTLRIDGDKANLSVVSQDGKSEFDGPVNTEAEKAKVPKPFQEKLEKLLDSRKNLQVMVEGFGELQPAMPAGIPAEHLRLIEEQRQEMERVKQQMEKQRQELLKLQEQMLNKAAPAGK